MVSTSSELIKRVENAVFHEPYMIPILFKERKVKSGFLHSRLRRYVPHRVGIEFECFGDFANQFILERKFDWNDFKKFESYFGLVDFSQDDSLNRKGRLWSRSQEQLIDAKEEIRVSISDYRQLHGLYNIMKEMAKYCAISKDCGIHIHIDLTKYDEDKYRKLAVNWFNDHMSEVESIFPKYTGTYNKRIAQIGKGSYVNLSTKGTVEFRIAPLTFDYEILINWIVKCSKLVSRMVIECHLKQKTIKDTKLEKLDNISQNGTTYTLSAVDLGFSELVGSNNVETIIFSRLIDELNNLHVDWHVSDGNLIIHYPDGEVTSIELQDVIRLVNNGEVNRIIERARTRGHGYTTHAEPTSDWTVSRILSNLTTGLSNTYADTYNDWITVENTRYGDF